MKINEELEFDRGMSNWISIDMEIQASDSEKARELHKAIGEKFDELALEIKNEYEAKSNSSQGRGLDTTKAPGSVKNPNGDESDE